MTETLQNDFKASRTRLGELLAEHQFVSESVARKEHEKRISMLTLKELEVLTPETPVYRTVGKSFFKGNIQLVRERLRAVGENSTIEREQLLSRKAKLEESILSAEQRVKLLYEELSPK